MEIVAALFSEDINLRQAPGGATRIDLGGVFFSMAAPSPAPVKVEPHLVVLIRCRADEPGNGVLEVRYLRGGEQIARNVSPFFVDPGKFTYRLVRAELEFDDYGAVEAVCKIDSNDHAITVPFTLLPPVA
jgi:hypothetical protein